MIPVLIAVSIRFSHRQLQIDMPEINPKVLLENLVGVLREFHLTYVTADLRRYCSRVNRYVEYERINEWQPLAEPVSMFNKKQWAIFIYQISTNEKIPKTG